MTELVFHGEYGRDRLRWKHILEGRLFDWLYKRKDLAANKIINQLMNKYILFVLLAAVVMSGGRPRFSKGNYVPITRGVQNILTFGCGMGSSWDNLYGVSSANVNFSYSNLPNWVTVQNGPMIAGTPGSAAGPAAITVTYTDASGNTRSENVVLAPSGTSSSTTVTLPGRGAGSPAGSSPAGGAVPLSQLPGNLYIPGNTSPAPRSPAGSPGAPGTTTTTVTETTLTTIVLPSPVYPTPTRLTLIPPDAPTVGTPRQNLPTSSPEEDSAVYSRVESAVKGLVNALDAVNRANTNINTLENDREKANNDLNNALNYLANTRGSLSTTQQQQRSNSDSVTTVTNDITNLQSQIDAANRGGNDIKSQIADLEAQLAAANAQTPVLQKTVDDILAAIANGQKALADAEDARDKALTNIARLRKIIADAQFALDQAPENIRRAKDALNRANDRVTELERLLAEAREAVLAAQKTLDDAKLVLVTAPRTIAEATAELNAANTQLPNLEGAITTARSNLDNLNRRRNDAANAITTNNRLIEDLTRRLAALRAQLGDSTKAAENFSSQSNQARTTLSTLRDSQATLDNNVGTLTEQLGIAESTVSNARAAIEEINNQLAQNRRLLDAARTALERARTEKALADQAMTEVVNRNGGTFPFPYIPGTGPFAMPGVTGNPQSNTVNPYAPGTTFGTGPGTTGGVGQNSGLPITVPAGSPLPSQSNPAGLRLGGASIIPGQEIATTKVVSTSQGLNISPSALFPPSATGTGAVGNAYGGRTVGGCVPNNQGTTASGSGNIVAINGNVIVLSNGGKVQFDGCTTVNGTPRVGGAVNWNGWYRQNTYVARVLDCK